MATRLGPFLSRPDFFRRQWQLHEGHLSSSSSPSSSWTHPELQAFRRYTKHFIVGPADHFPHTAVLSCPFHYHHLLRKTFLPSPTTTSPVFQPLRHGILLNPTPGTLATGSLASISLGSPLGSAASGYHQPTSCPSVLVHRLSQTVSAPLSQTVASAIFCLL